MQPYMPFDLRIAVQIVDPTFVAGEQQGAHEFLMCIVDCLQDTIQRANNRYVHAIENATHQHVTYHNSYFFFFYVLRHVRHIACKSVNVETQPMLDISIPVSVDYMANTDDPLFIQVHSQRKLCRIYALLM